MKQSPLLVLVLLCLCSPSLQESGVAIGDIFSTLGTEPTLSSHNVQSSHMFGDNINLEWVDFQGFLPAGAVTYYSSYIKRSDYICQHNCHSGYLNPKSSLSCHYPYGNREHSTTNFKILVNKDNFEVLHWLPGSYGSVPRHAVATCPDGLTYVGKNKYGLGKVVPHLEAFFLPWDGREHWYKHYNVLAINRDAYTQHIHNVNYRINQASLYSYPPEIVSVSTITNNECQAVVKKVTLSKTMETQTTWNIGRSTMQGVSSSITATIPYVAEIGVQLSSVKTLTLNRGTTVVEITRSESVEVNVPPNHSCSVLMKGHKLRADIPYSALLSRTYRNGDTRQTIVIGTYHNVHIGVVESTVGRCEPLANAKPC